MYVIIKVNEWLDIEKVYGIYKTIESAKVDARKMYIKDIDGEFNFYIKKIKKSYYK